MIISDAVRELSEFFRSCPRFYFLHAQQAGMNTISIVGLVLTRAHKKQAMHHSEAVWQPIRDLIEVALHLLAIYHMLVDSFVALIAYHCIQLFPKDNKILLVLHDSAIFVVIGGLALHLLYVLYENSKS